MKRGRINEISVIGVVIIAVLSLYTFFIVTPSPSEIYRRNINGVVELRSITEGYAEAFGTAEILTKDGELITNAHVVTYLKSGQVTEFESYSIRFSFENDYRAATLIKYDTELDIALLKLVDPPTFRLKPVSIGRTTKLKAGDFVYAIGNSMNYGISMTKGIVGVPIVEIEYSGTKKSVIQCDLTITEGNSGGALLDERGKLIGITTFRTKDNKGNTIYGLAYCIPIEIVVDYVNRK